ncbi:MAG: phosphomannomutase/phosphoglucomutase [Patescibacteria group bacterium]
MKADPSIFRGYDIRGVYPNEINGDTVYAAGKAYATLLSRENPGKRLSVAVGRDTRVSSPELHTRLIEGLLECGVDVDDLGLVSTPTLYFGVGFFGYDGGLQVSASHNPKEWNGVKMTRKNAESLSKETGIAEIATIIEKEGFMISPARGTLKKREGILAACVEEAVRTVSPSRIKPFKVVADAANAMGALDLAALFSRLGCDFIPMNFELDGTFPAHGIDPSKEENIKYLQEKVKSENADLGIAPDGDGDRIFFVDEKGSVVPSEALAAILAEIELEAHPGGAIVSDAGPSRIVEEVAERFGGRRVRSRVGSSYMKEAIIREGAVFGGEAAGHYYYSFPCGIFEAPMLLVLKLLARLSEKNISLSEAVNPFLKYAHSKEASVRVNSKEEVSSKIETVKKIYADGKQDFLDGVSVEYPDYWFTVRGSNTEPLLRFTLEATSKEIMTREAERLRGVLTHSTGSASILSEVEGLTN